MDIVETTAFWLDWLVRIVNISAFAGTAVALLIRGLRRRTVQRFFGGRDVTVHVPARILEGRSAVDEADLVAALTIQRFVGRYGITVHHRLIRPDGGIELGQDGTVVICGPKTSEVISRAMARDDVVGFKTDGLDWFLEDFTDGRTYHSPRDVSGESGDIGYLSRVGRSPGSRQTFLSIAGVHSQGSAIVVDHLCQYRTIRELIRLYGTRTFSAVFEGAYAVDPLTVFDSSMLFSHARDKRRGEEPAYAEVRTVQPELED